MIYNFNQCPKSGKTYYEINNQWKELKRRIKNILDSPQISRYEKCLGIESMLEFYRINYLEKRKEMKD